jgi:hypothetical protein
MNLKIHLNKSYRLKQELNAKYAFYRIIDLNRLKQV